MNILLTNDDGIEARGIAAMYHQLKQFGNVAVAAPGDRKSGAGHSITVYEPLDCEFVKTPLGVEGYRISGSPADCVKLAICQLLPQKPDLVVSGMNNGANVGINVYYSGTVGAAMEAAFYRIPSIAVSYYRSEDMNFELAAEYACEVIDDIKNDNFSSVVNINIPCLDNERKPKGIKIVPQSTLGFTENYQCQKMPSGKLVYQLNGGKHKDTDRNPSTDTLALEAGYITMTSLGFEMTDYRNMEKLHLVNWKFGG